MSVSVEVFHTNKAGKQWGVRTTEQLPKDTFVFEYAGEIITPEQFTYKNERASSNQPMYFFELQPENAAGSGTKNYYIDATRSGNASRFLNHCCKDANLKAVTVYTDHHDMRVMTLAFFTTREIRAHEELTISYGGDWAKNHDCQCQSCYNPTSD